MFKLKTILKFPARIKNCRNHYTAHTTVPIDTRDNSCVWNDNSVLQKSGIIREENSTTDSWNDAFLLVLFTDIDISPKPKTLEMRKQVRHKIQRSL